MREAYFIDKNKDRWMGIEGNEKGNPDEKASDFIDLVNDLSYAQSHYPHSNITHYINYVATDVYKSIFKTKRQSPFMEFWQKDFPLIIGHNKKVLWLALGMFLAFSVLGFVCSYLDANFIDSILGSNYVQMTLENIKKGQPFGVYQTSNIGGDNPFSMFLRIFANNLFVGLLLYMSGFLLGIGSFYFSFQNGLMFGSFMALFFQQHVGGQAVMVIMLHGTLELMGLVLEFMAGLILGLSFLFPGTLTRAQARKRGFWESAKIYIGTVPFTILAAFIESYVTHLGKRGIAFSQNNLAVTLLLLAVFIGSWVFVVWYYFIYSRRWSQTVPLNEYLKQTIH
jgi:uncharacterized membrane protein SpoIIM required for sporulation